MAHICAIARGVARKNPYVINLFEQYDIKDFSMLKNDMKLTNFKVNKNSKPLHWTSGKGHLSNKIGQWLQYRKVETGKISYDETTLFSEILVWRKTRKQAIPERHHHYYESCVGGGADGESPFDEDKDDDMEPEEQW